MWTPLKLFVPVLFLALLAVSSSEARSKDLQDIEPLKQWQHTFPGSLLLLEVTPQGYLHAVSRYGEKVKIGKSKTWLTKRFLMQNDRVFWEGEASETTYIGDGPAPLIMQAGKEGLKVMAIGSSGSPLWSQTLKGVPVSWRVDPSSGVVAIVLMPVGWTKEATKSTPARMVALHPATGSLRWEAPLGEITGAIESFGNEIGIQNGSVWWVAGGLAARISLENGQVAWAKSLTATTGPDTTWVISNAGAAAARGDHLFLFDPVSGLRWERQLRKDSSIGGLYWTSSGLLAKFQDSKGLNLAQLNPQTGESLWEKNLKHKESKFQGPPALGMAVTKDRVIVESNGVLHGYDLRSGQELFDEKIDRDIIWKMKVAENIRELRVRPDHLAIFGRREAAAFSLKDGKTLWSREGYEPPKDVAEQMRAGTLRLAVTTFHRMSPSYTSPEASSTAKHADDYAAGSWSNQSLIMQADLQQESYAVAQGEMVGVSLAKSISQLASVTLDVVNRRMPLSIATFYRVLGFKFGTTQSSNKASAVLLDLDSGTETEYRLPKAPTACIMTYLADPVGHRIFVIPEQIALMCKDENKLTAYRLP